MSLFQDRIEAGRILARKLSHLKHNESLIVLGLPRGGVPVAYEVAMELDAPLDVYVIRKLGVPEQPELALGAIAPGGIRVLNERVVDMLNIQPGVIDRVAKSEQKELERRLVAYRGEAQEIDVSDKHVLLVDDGLATGATMSAAVRAAKQAGAARIVIAVPVSAPDTALWLGKEVDEIVCAETPEPFYGVGQWYSDFSQTTDQEVKDILAKARRV